MSEYTFDVLIVGAGHAGVQAAAKLHAGSYEGTVGLLSAEATQPYERPPLTKGFLKGELSEAELLLRPASFWPASGVELLLDQVVVSLDPVEHVAVTKSGDRFRYSRLVWAAGADPVRINVPGVALSGVHELRSLEDTLRFREEVTPGARIVVVGGGYIGLEAASACVTLGAEVSVIEAQPRLLSRVTGTEVADHLLSTHRSKGVVVELGAGLAAIGGMDGRVTSVKLTDGRELAADVVLMSIGIRPNVAVLAEAGAVCSNGVDVDPQGRTSLPDVYAAGDCTCFSLDGGPRMRLESLQNAVDQGEHVARSIMGEDSGYSLEPYFWSHQYDIKVKTVGLFTGHDQTIVRKGAVDGSFSVVYLRGGRVCAVDTINAMKDYVDAHRVVGERVAPDLARDPSVRLRDTVLSEELDGVPS